MSEKITWEPLDEVVRTWVTSSKSENTEDYCWTATLIEADDGSGDAILEFPDELIKQKGWKEGTTLNLEVEQTPTGNVLVITEKK